MTVRILLADDHNLVRQMLRHFLESENEFELVGEAGDGRQALEMVATLKPDVLLLDLMMPRLNGSEVICRVRQQHPSTRVLVLSMHQEKAYVLRAIQNGAAGYVVKQADSADLIAGVRAVARGERYLSPKIAHLDLDAIQQEWGTEPLDPYEKLSPREREVFQLVAEGNTSSQVGTILFVNTRTVETHRANISRKLDLRNLSDWVRFAIEHGLLECDTSVVESGEHGGGRETDGG